VRNEVLPTILGMAIVTYATRVSGIWVMRQVSPSPRLAAWLRQVPGAILVSIVAPSALDQAPAGVVAVLVAAVVARRTRSVLLSMIGGIGVLLLARLLIAGMR
jgi:uncharacterized membrane protein